MKTVMVKRQKSLMFMLISLTFLFVLIQLTFYFIHYRVADLIDTLAASSIMQSLWSPVILLPIIQFVLLQCLAYVLFIIWLKFISEGMGGFFKLSINQTYYLGLIFWLLACIALLTLNNYFYPQSFFSQLINLEALSEKTIRAILIFSCLILFTVTIIAFINAFLHKQNLFIASVLSLLIISFGILYIYEQWLIGDNSNKIPNQQPNIILIGLDSLRPDFTSYFGSKYTRTPYIDNFLQTATVFTHAYTPLARTFPSWISILTALHPQNSLARNNLVDAKQILQHETLAAFLQKSGYTTIYATDEKRFSNITHEYGFDRIIGPPMGANDFLLGGLNDFPLTNLLINLPGGRFLFPFNYANRAAAITYQPDKFLQLIKLGLIKLPNKPVFIAIHLCVTHWPYVWAERGQKANHSNVENYARSVTTVDAQLGQLMAILQRAQLLDNSITVLLSDHGTTLGLPNDRIISTAKYHGDPNKLKMLTVARLSSAPVTSLDFQHDFSINTSYGQGTDLLSLKQYQILLAVKDFRQKPNANIINTPTSLLDVAPSVLAMANIPNFKSADGLNWYNTNASRPLVMETGDSLTEIETDHIYIEKVIKREIGVYRIDERGFLSMDVPAETSLIKNKQRSLLRGDWLLVRYPSQVRLNFEEYAAKSSKTFSKKIIPPYYVLANIKTGDWTIGLDTDYAKQAPITKLLKELNDFYGND